MRHFFCLVCCLLFGLVGQACDWIVYDDDDDDDMSNPSNDWPESSATDAELTSVAGAYSCISNTMGEADVVAMEDCYGQFQGDVEFTFAIATKKVDEYLVGGTSFLSDGALLDDDEWACPEMELFSDLSSCENYFNGHYDFELTVYEDGFAGHDIWTDGVVDNILIMHGYLVDSSKSVVIEMNTASNTAIVYLRDSGDDSYHDLFRYGIPSDYNWEDTLTCHKVSFDIGYHWTRLDLCNYDCLGSHEYIQ